MDVILLAEIIGFTATAIGTCLFQIKTPRTLLLSFATLNSLWLTYFLLLGETAGAIMISISMIRNVCGALLPARYMKLSTISCALLACATIIPSINAAHDWFLLVPVFTIGLASLARAHPTRFRFMNLTGELGWISYGICISSLSFSLSAALAITSIMISIARYDFGLLLTRPLLAIKKA